MIAQTKAYRVNDILDPFPVIFTQLYAELCEQSDKGAIQVGRSAKT